jgi:hypothetical protein
VCKNGVSKLCCNKSVYNSRSRMRMQFTFYSVGLHGTELLSHGQQAPQGAMVPGEKEGRPLGKVARKTSRWTVIMDVCRKLVKRERVFK